MVRSPDAPATKALQHDDMSVASTVQPDDVPQRSSRHEQAEKKPQSVDIEKTLTAIRSECDKICSEHPDNFLFTTKYGGAVTQEKYDQDKQTDLDLRLVCFILPDEVEQDKIKKRLQDIEPDLEVELYFHTFDKFIAGQVGETGDTTVLEKIKNPDADESTVVHIEYPSLLSFYTFATMDFFTNRKTSELQTWIESVTEKYLASENATTLPVSPTIEMLDPQHIVEQISISERDVIEWIHVYVEHFLHDFQSFHALSESAQNNASILNTYLSRISKYLVRIAFGVAILDRNNSSIEFVEEMYLWYLRLGVHAEEAHFQVISDIAPSWFNTSLKNSINMASYIRAFSNSFAEDENDISDYYELIGQIENTLLYVVQQGGGVIRRSEFNDVHDFLTEHAILNQIEKQGSNHKREFVLQGTEILSQGDKSEEIIIIPTNKTDGSKNGTCKISIDGEVVALDRSKVIVGELGVLLDIPRTTSVIAAYDLELITIPKQEVERLFLGTVAVQPGSPERSILQNYFSGHYLHGENQLETSQDAQLIFSLLGYLSDEFLKYLEEALKSGRKFDSQAQSDQQTMLDLYEINHLPSCFDWLIEHDKKSDFTVTEYSQPQVLFNVGETSDLVYFVHTASQTGGVEVTFQDGTSTLLQSGEVIGEDALLPNENTRNYTVTVLPGTKLISASSEGFRDATSSTDTIFATVEGTDGQISLEQYTRREVFFAVGVQCLKRLQSMYRS